MRDVALGEGVVDGERRGLAAVAATPVVLVAERDPELNGAGDGIGREEAALPDHLAVGLDDEVDAAVVALPSLPERGGVLLRAGRGWVADERALRRAVRPTTAIFADVSLVLLGIGTRRDAAGHMLVHVFDDDGRIVSAERAIALSVAQLRRARVVAAAGGRSKRRAVLGALRTGLVDVLVTDIACARHALA